MARYTGLTLATYRRVERGRIDAPNLRYLANCALVLRCEVEDPIEDEWRQWWVFDAARPPDDAKLAQAAEDRRKARQRF